MKAHQEENSKIKIGHAHIRPRRLRQNTHIRSLVQETSLSKNQLIYPIFISEIDFVKTEIQNLPNIFRIPANEILIEIKSAYELGIRNIMLFPVISKDKKDTMGSHATCEIGLMQNCIQAIKKNYPEIILFADVALDPYTTHGHDGIVDDKNYVLNDETIQVLCKQALSYAKCGVDFVCPSDMMDGRVGAIRHFLDENNFQNTGILAYSAKFASCFYGPFRYAVGSGEQKLDKKSYQLSFTNSREALHEVNLDIEEGADIIMVKPGLPYLDILSKVKAISPIPIAVYQVSGEYAMLKLGAQNGLFDEKQAVYESLIAMKRAGADMIISYYAKWVCEHILDLL